VQLQHILSLWKILDESLCVDPFANVHSKFKVEMEENEKKELAGVNLFHLFSNQNKNQHNQKKKKLNQNTYKNPIPTKSKMKRTKQNLSNLQVYSHLDAAPKLELRVLVPSLKEFMLNYCHENSSLGPDYFLKDVIGEYSGFYQLIRFSCVLSFVFLL
jgi:hypothetical protein